MVLKKKCACNGSNLDKFIQPVILYILSKNECSGYRIIQEMGTFVLFKDGLPDATGVYRYLKSMENRGHIEACEYYNENNIQKKKYKITELGLECLGNWKHTLMEYQDTIGQLIQEITS